MPVMRRVFGRFQFRGAALWGSVGFHAVLLSALFLWKYHTPAAFMEQMLELTVTSAPEVQTLSVPEPVTPVKVVPPPIEQAPVAAVEVVDAQPEHQDGPGDDEGSEPAGDPRALLAMVTSLKTRTLPVVREMEPSGDFAPAAELQLGMDALTIDRLVQTSLAETRLHSAGWGIWGFGRVRMPKCIPANEGIP